MGKEVEYKQNPLLSIITVVYNGVESIEKTISSVTSLSYENIEYIIIDGASIDGTVDVIRRYDYLIDCWISEEDDGIYDAMNKGIALSTGDYLWFVNSGDVALTVPVSLNYYSDNNGMTLISCPVRLMKESGSIKYYGNFTPPHQGLLYSRIIFERLGGYDTKYKLISDRVYYDRIRKYDVSIVKEDNVICCFDMSGISSSDLSEELNGRDYNLYFYSSPSLISFYRYARYLLSYLMKKVMK